MIQCVIIEDEKASQDTLIRKLNFFYPNINIKAVIDNAPEAITYLSENKIDLVFVDNHIKQGRGMDVINHFQEKKFKVIFSTAFSEYAIEALNKNASYYLLKPYSDSEFKTAINKCITSLKETSKSITIGSNKEIIAFKTILYLQSEGAYTIFHLENGKTIYTSKNIGYYEKKLPSKFFFRIHHSTIVNQLKIEKIHRGINTMAILKNGIQLKISTRKQKDFLIQFQDIN
jgi:two-component system LytT family response regulator